MRSSLPQITPLNLSVNTVYCVGRNYAKHAKELGNAVPKEPMIFLKPNACVSINPSQIQLPEYSQEVHHELELVVALKSNLERASLEEADNAIGALAIGLDLTARDIQNQIKAEGKPWTRAKCFRQSAVVSEWVAFEANRMKLDALELRLDINGECKQQGNTSDMIFTVNHLLQYLSHQLPLYAGDILFTGTPEGVGPLASGDRLSASIPALDCQLNTQIV